MVLGHNLTGRLQSGFGVPVVLWRYAGVSYAAVVCWQHHRSSVDCDGVFHGLAAAAASGYQRA